ncbi:hypothetical protein HDU67_010328, partial [Dinochytrium kinnereticum]
MPPWPPAAALNCLDRDEVCGVGPTKLPFDAGEIGMCFIRDDAAAAAVVDAAVVVGAEQMDIAEFSGEE